ncbi:MAG: LapA family protein [Proteobacteria bacterium]|nr:MAG: LapA family protein [Pseudomonadota bacterium]
MRKSTQTKIAVLCLLLISKTTLASDFGGPAYDFDSADVKLNIGDLTGFKGSKPGFIPKRFNLEGFSNLTPYKPKIPGTFGTPEAELAKGHAGQAKVSCIQEAVSNNEFIPNASASSAWEFAAKGLISRGPALASLSIGKSVPLKFGDSTKPPKAFSKKNLCGSDNVKHGACAQLLSKSLTEVPQAYYKSEVTTNPDVWEEVADFYSISLKDDETGITLNFTEALTQKTNELEKNIKKDSSPITASNFIGKDPVLLATNLLIASIDEALSKGDREASNKAMALLAKINPSAKYAVRCVLGSVSNGGLNDDLDPSGRPTKGSMVGPLTGTDYGSKEMIKYGEPTSIVILTAIGVGVAIGSLITLWANRSTDSERYEKDQQDKQLDKQSAKLERLEDTTYREKVFAADQLKEYMKCDLGGEACGRLYPEAAKAVVESKKAPVEVKVPTGTTGPEKRVEDDMWAPMVKQKIIPGSGGAGGELLPPDLDLSKPEPYYSGSSSGEEAFTRIDPSAGQRFCDQTVRDYKAFAIKRLTSGGRPVETLPKAIPISAQLGASLALGSFTSGSAYGVAAFDQWDRDFWNEQIDIYLDDPTNHAKENDCKSKDPVRPE